MWLSVKCVRTTQGSKGIQPADEHMEKSDHYKGREHSGIKHYLLESYLELLFMIIGQHEKRICYIDCFSGPWKSYSPMRSIPPVQKLPILRTSNTTGWKSCRMRPANSESNNSRTCSKKQIGSRQTCNSPSMNLLTKDRRQILLHQEGVRKDPCTSNITSDCKGSCNDHAIHH